MIILLSYIIIFCVSTDGFALGYTFQHNKIKINALIYTTIGAATVISSGIAMTVGSLFFGKAPERDCAVLSSFLLFILAYRIANRQIPQSFFDKENIFTAIFINEFAAYIDVSIASLYMSFDGLSDIFISLAFALTRIILIYYGYKTADFSFSSKIKSRIPVYSSIIIAALAIFRLI